MTEQQLDLFQVSPQRGDASGEAVGETAESGVGAPLSPVADQAPRTQLSELPGESWEDLFGDAA